MPLCMHFTQMIKLFKYTSVSYIVVEDQAGKNATSTFKKPFPKKASGMPNMSVYTVHTHLYTHLH